MMFATGKSIPLHPMPDDFLFLTDTSATSRFVPPPAVGSRRRRGVVTMEAHIAHVEYRPKVEGGSVHNEPGSGQPRGTGSTAAAHCMSSRVNVSMNPPICATVTNGRKETTG